MLFNGVHWTRVHNNYRQDIPLSWIHRMLPKSLMDRPSSSSPDSPRIYSSKLDPVDSEGRNFEGRRSARQCSKFLCLTDRLPFSPIGTPILSIRDWVGLDDIVTSPLIHVGNFFKVTNRLLVCPAMDLADTDGRYSHYSLEHNRQCSHE